MPTEERKLRFLNDADRDTFEARALELAEPQHRGRLRALLAQSRRAGNDFQLEDWPALMEIGYEVGGEREDKPRPRDPQGRPTDTTPREL